MDTGDQIPSNLPLLKGGIPLFEKEGLGEIFGRICLFNYGLVIKWIQLLIKSGEIFQR
jgi:hypothetical protein